MIDLDGGYRLEICPGNKRDKQTLKALITKHVANESTIMTDCWKGYISLDKAGFRHLTVNHKYNFVDPDTLANTQKIKLSWRNRLAEHFDTSLDHLSQVVLELFYIIY
jgi:transposase-like protein